MRPPLLDPLFASLRSLPGVGPRMETLFARLLGRGEAPPRAIDLLLHLPSGTVDRRARPKVRDVIPGSVATLALTVQEHRPPPPHRQRAPYQVLAADETADVILTFFRGHKDHLQRLLPVGELRYVSGTADLYDGVLQMVHPDRIVSAAELDKLPLVEPVYPLTEGLTLNPVRKAVDAALDRLPALPEWQDAAWVAQQRFPPFAAALTTLHRPQAPADATPDAPAWTRLAYDELLAGQLALTLVRAHQRKQPGRGSSGEGLLRARITQSLPYALTPSQGARGGRHRDGAGAAPSHGAAAARRRRLRQNGRRADGSRDRRRGRAAGGSDGADGNSRPPAHGDHRPARGRPSASAPRS